jgi:ABC-2 type transport system permease protein
VKPFARLVWKEGRELLRPQYILPLVFIPVLFVAMGGMMSGLTEDLADQPRVGIVNEDGDRLGDVAVESIRANAEVVYHRNESPGSYERAAKKVKRKDGNVLLVLPANFTERIRDGKRATVAVHTPVEEVSLLGVASSAKAGAVLAEVDRNVTIAATNATAETLSPTEQRHTTYVKGRTIQASPAAVSGAFLQQFIFVPIVIVFAILISGQMVIQSMGIEKENRTLEMLLTMPVERWKLVAAKLTAGGALGLVATVLYMGGIAFYQTSFTMLGPGTASFSLGPVDYVLVGASLFFALAGVLALALCLGLFVDDRQGAQVLLFPVSMLALVPMFATMFTDFDVLGPGAKVILFLIPFTHPIIAPKRLLFGDYGLVLAGIGYELVFAVGMVWLAARLFRSDRLVTGRAGRLQWLLDKLQR